MYIDWERHGFVLFLLIVVVVWGALKHYGAV